MPVLAGTSAKEVVAPAPAPAPCLFTWFVGGSAGYLTELEEPMYNVHVGTDTCWSIGGWNLALFAEVGYTEKDEDWSGRAVATPTTTTTTTTTQVPGTPLNNDIPQTQVSGPSQPGEADIAGFDGGLDDLESFLNNLAGRSFTNTGYDLEILPITFNAKLERPLTGNLNAYFGGGLGVAKVDLDVNGGDFGNFSDDDWVFVGQIFAGLNYNFTPNFEVYGGARYIYLDSADLDLGGTPVTLDNDEDFLLELGARYNF